MFMKKILPAAKGNFLFHVVCFFLLSTHASLAQTPVLFFNPVITAGLSSPIDLVNAADGSGRMFILQQNGIIRYARGTTLSDTVFLDIGNVISSGGERGSLSIAFHPQYRINGYFFVYYTNIAGDVTLARYQVSSDPNLADPATGRVLLSVPHTEFSN